MSNVIRSRRLGAKDVRKEIQEQMHAIRSSFIKDKIIVIDTGSDNRDILAKQNEEGKEGASSGSVYYTRREIDKLSASALKRETVKAVHAIKKIFDGTIFRIESPLKKTEANTCNEISLVAYSKGIFNKDTLCSGVGVAIYRTDPSTGESPTVVETVSEKIGAASNQEAELEALKIATEKVSLHNPVSVIFKLDNPQTILQAQGKQPVNKTAMLITRNAVLLGMKTANFRNIIIKVPETANGRATDLALRALAMAQV